MQKVIDGIYWVERLLMGRVYVLESQDGLTLIDTSNPGSMSTIAKQLAAHGRSINEVKRILITHAHPDHIGSLGAIQAATQAQVYVHRHDAATIRGEAPMPRPAPQTLDGFARLIASVIHNSATEPAPVMRELQDGERLDEALPGLQVVATPGHTPGHVSYWLPSQRLLFTGDVVMRMGNLRLPFAAFTPDMAAEKRSLQRVAQMEIDILCFGHGNPIIGKASTALRKFAASVTAL